MTEQPKSATAADNTAGWLRGLDRLPPPAIVVTAILSIQLGAAVATELFESVGPTGATFLRLALGLVVLLAVGRPRLRGAAPAGSFCSGSGSASRWGSPTCSSTRRSTGWTSGSR